LDELVASCSWSEQETHPERTLVTRHLYSTPLALSRVVGLLADFSLSDADRAIISPLEVVLQHHLVNNDESQVIAIKMAGSQDEDDPNRERRTRSLDRKHRVDLHQGPSPQGAHVYVGDAGEHSVNSITMQIHDIDFSMPGSSDSIRIHALAIWIPTNVRRSVWLE
jgi:hypothetical protein